MKYGVKLKKKTKYLLGTHFFADICLKAKKECGNNKITANFNGKAPKEEIKRVCLSAIVIYSVFKSDKNYFPQVFLEECKYKIKEREKNNKSKVI